LELTNSSIENLTDLVSKEKLPLAGKVKDLSAAAVLVFSLIALIAGIIIFAKYLFN
jgi:diacylglycerol kinase